MFRSATRFLALSLVAAAFLLPATASADGLTVSFPSRRPYYAPGSSSPTVSFPWGNMVVTFPDGSHPAVWLPSWDGPLVAEAPSTGMTIDFPNSPPADLAPNVYPVIDLSNTSGVQVEFPGGYNPVVTFPGSWRPAIQLPSGAGLTVTGYSSGTLVISFPGTSNPPVTLYGWQQRPRVDLPGGGSLVVDLPYGAAPPLDLNPGAGLTVEMPAYQTRTFWFVKRTSYPAWNYWY